MAERTKPVDTPTPQSPSAATPASTAHFSLPAEGFALADLFERVPDARIECETAVANPADHALLVVRTTEPKREIDAGFRADPTVGGVECFGERPEGWAYRVTWEGRPRRLIQRLVAADVTLLSTTGQNGHWELRVLTPDRPGIARADEILDDLDCQATCQRISRINGESSNCQGLTDKQREALVAAFEAGHYTIPRSVSAQDLAETLGISHQALSERLRRGHEQVVGNQLTNGDR